MGFLSVGPWRGQS